MFSQSAGVYLTIMNCFSAMSFSLAHDILLIAFASDLENEILTLNKNIKLERGKNENFSVKRLVEIKRQLNKIIQLQCDTKQLSELIIR